MANNKMTKLEALTAIKEIVKDNADLTTFVDNEIALLEKRRNTTSKAKKAKDEINAKLMQGIVEVLTETTEGLSTMAIGTAIGVSPQKATYLLKNLASNGTIVVNKVKDKNLYSIA